MRVELSSLVGRTIQEVRAFVCPPVDPAWVDELTTSIVTSAAFLQLVDGILVRVEPCEVESRPGGYPDLGLSLEICEASALRMSTDAGKPRLALPVDAAAPLLPFTIVRADESDPLKERGAIEFRLIGARGEQLVLRHILPPITLGIAVRAASHAPNTSLERTRAE
jgi:hypothetical protein